MDITDIGYLYIIKDSRRTGWVKIGKTINPSSRLKQYNGSFPDDPMYYSYVSERIYNLSNAEKELIDYITTLNVTQAKSEWFRFNTYTGRAYFIDYIINKIEQITDNYFEGE